MTFSGLSPRITTSTCSEDYHHDLTANAKQPQYRLVDLGTFGGPVSIVTGGNGDLNQENTLVTHLPYKRQRSLNVDFCWWQNRKS
jgi:hypothetical protein